MIPLIFVKSYIFELYLILIYACNNNMEGILYCDV